MRAKNMLGGTEIEPVTPLGRSGTPIDCNQWVSSPRIHDDGCPPRASTTNQLRGITTQLQDCS